MLKYVKRHFGGNAVLFLLIIVGALSKIYAAIQTAAAFNAIVAVNWDLFIHHFILVAVSFAGYLLSLLIKIPLQASVTQGMMTAIRTDIARNLEQIDYESYHKSYSGAFVSWLTNDMRTIEQEGFRSMYEFWTMGIEFIFSVLGLLYFHWSIVLFSIAASLVTILLPQLVQAKVGNSVAAMSQQQETFTSRVTNILQGFDTLFALNRPQQVRKEIAAESKTLAQKTVTMNSWIALSAVLGAIGNLMSQVGLIAFCALLTFKKWLSIGAIVGAESMSNTIFNAIGNITQYIVAMKSVQPLFDKYKQLEKVAGQPQPVYKKDLDLRGNLELSNLTFSYDKGTPVFERLNATFEAGKKYALVGGSGSGKTTLLNLLAGKLTGYTGSLQLNGNELRQINGRNLRDTLLYVDQTPYIFSGTIRDNVLLGENYSDEEIWVALEEAGLADKVRQLPDGLDNELGESGRSLSGGEKQRLTLARGFLRHKAIILLDEGTSSLDEDTALAIEKSLVKKAGLTLIMITHHLHPSIEAQLDGVLDLQQVVSESVQA